MPPRGARVSPVENSDALLRAENNDTLLPSVGTSDSVSAGLLPPFSTPGVGVVFVPAASVEPPPGAQPQAVSPAGDAVELHQRDADRASHAAHTGEAAGDLDLDLGESRATCACLRAVGRAYLRGWKLNPVRGAFSLRVLARGNTRALGFLRWPDRLLRGISQVRRRERESAYGQSCAMIAFVIVPLTIHSLDTVVEYVSQDLMCEGWTCMREKKGGVNVEGRQDRKEGWEEGKGRQARNGRREERGGKARKEKGGA